MIFLTNFKKKYGTPMMLFNYLKNYFNRVIHASEPGSILTKYIKSMVFFILLFLIPITRVSATPHNNPTDTQIVHTVMGTDKFYTKKEKGEIRLHLSPYFQHAGAARNGAGRRVPLGERFGTWNMSGLFFGLGGMPTGKTLADYKALNDLKSDTKMGSQGTMIKSIPGSPITPSCDILVVEVPQNGHISADKWNVVGADIPTTVNNQQITITQLPESARKQYYQNLLVEKDFNPDINTPTSIGFVDVKHEKLGLRGQLTSDFGFGLGVSVKGGIVDYKERPTFTLPRRYQNALGMINLQNTDSDWFNATYLSELEAIKALNVYLFTPPAREALFKDVGLDLKEVRDTCLEDMHMQLYWHFPYQMKEKGELTVTTVPYMAVGLWLPTGKVKDQDKAFSIDTGNGGFYGLTFEGSISFDFPKLIQTNFGGGALISMNKEFTNYRVPSCDPAFGVIKQSGFYPWKTTIGRAPGITWYGNASFKADGFNDALSLYFDYIYTYHQKDTITLREKDTKRFAAFGPGVTKLEDESIWKTQLLNVGLDYRINPNLSFGGAVQSMIGGTYVFKTTTMIGSMTLTF